MGTMTFGGMATGPNQGPRPLGAVTTTGANLIDDEVQLTLATGDNTIAVPPGASCAFVCLGDSPTVTVTVRTNLNSADAGLRIAPFTGASWAKFDLPSGVTSLVLHSSGSLSNVTVAFI